MARYRLLRAHFLAGRHFLAGAVIDWDGPPSRFMEPIDDEAKAVMAAQQAKRTQQSGRSPRPARTQQATPVRRAGLRGALHAPATPPGDRPLWCGFTPVVPDAQGRPAPPPTFPEYDE